MPDPRILERLQRLEQCLRKLEAARGVPRDDYLADTNLQDIVERNFQVAVQALLDIGNHLIAREGLRLPQDNDDVFRALAEGGLLPADLAARLRGLGGFLNLLVHDYLAVDPERVYEFLDRIGDLREAAAAARAYEATR